MASLKFERQKPIALKDKRLKLDCGYRLDFLLEDKLVIELKSVEALIPIFDAQILTYMRLTGVPLGLLMNFNAPVLKDGLKRFVR
jgi:GxxExxY protein